MKSRFNLAGSALILAGASAMLSPLPANAQARPQAAPDNAIGELVVTARRREERLIDVPISVTSVSGEALAAASIGSTRDLSEIAPGLTTINQGFAFQPAIRGVTSTVTSPGSEPNVALYVDGVYMPGQSGNAFDLKNIERVEVLKGPQGTLFGRNSTGGAIQVITADPSFTPQLHATGSYGFKLKSRDLSAYASGGLSETLAVGVTASYHQDDGYLTNVNPAWTGHDLGDSKRWGWRGKLLWKPVTDLKVVLEADRNYANNSLEFSLAPILNSTFQTAGAILPTGRDQVSTTFRPMLKLWGTGQYILVVYDLPKFALQSQTAHRKATFLGHLDPDRSQLPTQETYTSNNIDYVTQEFLATSKLDGPVNFVAGAFFYRAKGQQPVSVAFTNGVKTANLVGVVHTKSAAVFGEGTYNLTDTLILTGGLRWTHDRKDYQGANYLTNVQGAFNENAWSNLAWRVAARYRFTDQSNVYATVSTGFKSGEFSGPGPTTSGANPEHVTAYEAGFKTVLANRFLLTAAVFHYDYKDIQSQVGLTSLGGTVGTLLTNAARAKIDGAEVQFQGRIAPHLNVNFGASYLPKAKYLSFTNATFAIPKTPPPGSQVVVRDISGQRMIRSPKWTWNLGANYDAPLAGGELKASASYSYSTHFTWVPGSTASQPNYGVLNARLGWSPPGGHYTVSVWANNLNNAAYYVYSTELVHTWDKPREIGVSVDIDY